LHVKTVDDHSKIREKMQLLQYWLLFVCILSVFGALNGIYEEGEKLKIAQFSLQTNQVTPLAGRIFSAWTLLAGILRGHCAIYINEKGLYRTTMWSFIIALVVYIYEVTTSQTVPLLHALAPLFIATTSLVWMSLTYRSNILTPKEKSS